MKKVLDGEIKISASDFIAKKKKIIKAPKPVEKLSKALNKYKTERIKTED